MTSPARLVRGVRKAAGTGFHHPPALWTRGPFLLVLVIAFFRIASKFANIIREAPTLVKQILTAYARGHPVRRFLVPAGKGVDRAGVHALSGDIKKR